MKKVLIVTFYFPPAATAAIHRILGFSKYLPDFGWEPIILTVKKKYYDEKILTYDTTDEVSDNLLIYKTGMIGWVRDLLKIIRYFLKTKGFTKEKQNINIIKDNRWFEFCVCSEAVDRAGLKIPFPLKECGFDSRPRHLSDTFAPFVL